MGCEHSIALRLSVFANAMKAQVGTIVAADVALLILQVRELDQGDVLRRAVEGFADRYAVVRRDPRQLAELGRTLSAFIANLNMPDPVDQHRKDIYG